MINEPTVLPPRLFTTHGTVLYVDPRSGELRHGSVADSPANARFVSQGVHGQIMHEAAGSLFPIVCRADRSQTIDSGGGSPTPTVFELVRLDWGRVGLRAEGIYLCAEPGGYVTLSRSECGAWEAFLLSDSPSDPNRHHPGVDYLDFLGVLAASLGPRSYFEIGTGEGDSLARFSCDALCVEPAFRLTGNPLGHRKRSLFFQMSSDEFFAMYDLRLLFPRGVDIAFLDGMHRFEYLLRDFMNTERCCHDRSLILLHDCLPVNLRMAERKWFTDPDEQESTRSWWAGDVWRLLPILKKYRPDLRVLFLDCPPTGLTAVTNLDPRSAALRHSYYTILDEFSCLDLSSYGLDQLWSLFPTLKSQDIIAEEVLTSIFSVF